MENFVKNANCLNCENCFMKNPLFGLLSESELGILNKGRAEVSFKRGEVIYKQGMPLTHLVTIHKGYGKIYIEGSNGKNLILSYSKDSDINGGIGIFIDQIHHSSLMAVNDCHTCFIDINSFNEVIEINSIFRNAYLKVHSEKVLQTYHQFTILTQKNMEGRMAESILYLKDNVFNNGSLKDVSKQDLAEFTAMSKESAIRVLKEFKDEGFIEFDGKNIAILNESSLRNIAEHG